jgi:hypothetical protein
MSVAAFISLVSSLVAPNKLILSDQNGTRPAKPYATISVRTVTPARPQQSIPDATGAIDISQQQLNNIEIQFFGDNSVELANNLSLKLRFPSTSVLADTLNVGIGRVNQVLRVPELLNASQFEERAILEFTAYDVLSGIDQTDLIEKVEIECFDHVHLVDTSPTTP